MGKKKTTGDKLVQGIVDDVRFDRADAIVMIGIPSHDQKKTPLASGKQSQWATAAMEHFADLFGGATALRTFKGIYKSTATEEYLWDDTILIQSFTDPDSLQDEITVSSVVEFARRMRLALSQEAVFLVFNNVVRFVEAGR